MLRLCFDEEVDSELVEGFRKSLQRLRWPQSVFNTFTFAVGVRSNLSRTLSQRNQSIKNSQISQTNVANIAKKKANQNRGSFRRHKNGVTEDNGKRQDQAADQIEEGSDDESIVADFGTKRGKAMMKEESPLHDIDALAETTLCKDYERVGLGSVEKLVIGSPWRLSMANLNYNVCRGFVYFSLVFSVFLFPRQ